MHCADSFVRFSVFCEHHNSMHIRGRYIYNKELSYRRGTARRAVSVETVRNVAQMFVKLH